MSGLVILNENTSDRRVRPFLSVKEGAEILGVNPYFIYERIGRKNGPPYKKRGSKIVLPREEFLVWADQKIIK